MQRKVRHPYQILEPEELVVGEQYVFVFQGGASLSYDLYIFGGIIKDNQSIIKNPPDTSPPTVTIHPKGLMAQDFAEYRDPTFMYWRTPNRGWDNLSTYLSEPLANRRCSIIVPEKHWKDDPHFYDDVVERKISQTPKGLQIEADWEQKMRTKRDIAMAKALGF